MQIGERLEVGSRVEWRDWLEANHANRKEIWLTFYKKASGKQGISYEDSVLEALCFGWIDGQTRSMDAERYALRFTPRRPGGNWSESNRQRVARLLEEGRMAPAGIAVLPPDLAPRC